MNRTAYDLIIVGAGSIGLPTALAAQRAGLKTLVIEKLPSIGQGENKSAIGGVRATHSDPAKILVALRSLTTFREWQQREGDDIGWQQGGYLFPIYREQDEQTMRGLMPVQHSYGLNIAWIDQRRVTELVPGIKEAGLLGGAYSPEDGNISPLKTINAYYFAAQRSGAEFRFQETVTAVAVEHDSVAAVVTNKNRYACRFMLNAAGSAASEIGKLAHLDLPVHPDSHEAGITEPIARVFAPLIVDIRPAPGAKNCYFYQNSAQRLVFCLTPDPLYPGTNRQSHSSFLPIVARKMIDLIPRLANIRIRRVWRGCYPQTPDGMPVIGEAPRIRGYYFAVGLCGQGLMLGPGLAEDIVSLLLKGKPVTDANAWSSFSLTRDFGRTESLK